MTNGYRALRESAAKIDLSARGRIRVTGDDRARLLHAMTTNDVGGLKPGSGCYAFFLNAQGRILADAVILCFEDSLLLDTEPESRGFLMEHLDKYIIADDVVLEDVTDSVREIAIEGPQAADFLSTTPGTPFSHTTHGGLTVVRASTAGECGFRVLGSGALPDVPNVDADDVNVVRHENFFPRYGEDISSSSLPQETGITTALHFSKGCYLGQEIVERVRSRGHVNRMLMGLSLDGDAAVGKGTKVVYEDAEVGEVTSAAFSPAVGKTFAMGYLRVVAAKPGTIVQVDGRPAQVSAIKSSRT